MKTCIIDPRNVHAGRVIHDVGGYYDGQSIVVSKGSEVISLVFHHSHNHEGGPGLRLYSAYSVDKGRTWSKEVPIEDSLTMPSHDGYQLVDPNVPGKTYLIYGYNDGKLHYEDANGAHFDLPRGDMQCESGFKMKVSTNGGMSYGEERFDVPVRRTKIDVENPWKGSTIGAFCCDKPVVIDGKVFFAFQKTIEGGGETPESEIFIMKSDNLLTVGPERAKWETLPKGDVGLSWKGKAGLDLGEEPHIINVFPNDPNRLMCFWRTQAGVIARAYSDDGGETFGEVEAMTYDGNRIMKNPRGSLTPHLLPGGRQWLLIFYNNSHTAREGYVGRRYYFYTVGTMGAGQGNEAIAWTEPELALWWDGESLDDRPDWNADWAIVDGPGYPDFATLPDGTISFVQSNKLTLRYHTVDERTLQFLREQSKLDSQITEGLVCSWANPHGPCRSIMLPSIQSKAGGYTFSFTIKCRKEDVKPRQVLVDARQIVTAAQDKQDAGDYITKGFTITVEGRGKEGLQLCLSLNDGRTKCKAFTDGLKWDGQWHGVSIIVDAGPRIICCVVDERLCDGGQWFPEGWSVINEKMGSCGGADLNFFPEPTVTFPSSGPFKGQIGTFDVFDRPLLVSEAISHWRGRGKKSKM